MKKQLRILALVAGLLGTSVTMAYSSDIVLGSASAKANELLSVDLSELYPGVNYKVTCQLRNDAKSPSTPKTDVLIYPQQYESRFFLIDGKEVSINQPFLFNSTGATFEGFNIQNGVAGSKYLTIKNLDRTDPISLNNCVATIMH